METIRKNIVLLLLSLALIGTVQQKATAQTSVSFQLFYDNLSVYGNWIDDPQYGYVWSPRLGHSFAPYRTNGYWSYTDVGWTWVSYYPWGWAPFHYGRWFYDSYYGWLWVPDTQWGPAWVTWRYYDGYYGWAAIGPGISIDIAFGGGYSVPYSQWVFVREKDFCRRTVSNYYVKTSDNVKYVRKSRVMNKIHNGNNGRYNAGPDRSHVQKRAGTSIAEMRLKDRGKPGQSVTKNELQLYKPRVERDDNKRMAPEKFVNRKDNQKEPRVINNRNVQNRQSERKVAPDRFPAQNKNVERKIQQKRESQTEMHRQQDRPVFQEQRENRQNRKEQQQIERPMRQQRNDVEQYRNNQRSQSPFYDLRGNKGVGNKPTHENNRGKQGR